MLELDEEYDELEEKSWSKKLLGKDFGKIPCMQNSFLCGFTTGAFTGLAGFLFTSRARFSFSLGFYTYIAATLSYWVQCRYKYEKNTRKMKELLTRKSKKEPNSEETHLKEDKVENVESNK